MRSRRAHAALVDAQRVHDLLVAARQTPLPASAGLSLARANELIREIRTGRDLR